MGYHNLQSCVSDLEKTRQLIRIDQPIDPYLEVAEIQRRAYAAKAPALLFTQVRGTPFPILCNLYGTLERAKYIFRDTLEKMQRLIEVKVDPAACAKRFWEYRGVPFTALKMLPRSVRSGPSLNHQTSLSQLPGIVSWPEDGGPFITLPQVYSENVNLPGVMHSNLGMYRVQLSGNDYEAEKEVGLHYQIHRSIGVHHQNALDAGKPFQVNIFVGGPPAMTLAAVMPLPEGMSELMFAGVLSGRRTRMIHQNDAPAILAEADFCIRGTVDPNHLKPEGPFGDHLGYYSRTHPFPVLKVEHVTHRPNAIWPFTVVGRPPQEDTIFGDLIHMITGSVIPSILPGVHEINAVDAAGVHPLLLAIGSERYTPYSECTRPKEILTQAHALLGQGQLSLAKFLLITNHADDPTISTHDHPAYFKHLLQRADWRRDLHFQTRTTIDTLDYSGTALNEGSKVVIAAAGPATYRLETSIPSDLRLPTGYKNPKLVAPGILAIEGPKRPAATLYQEAPPEGEIISANRKQGMAEIDRFCEAYTKEDSINQFRMLLIVDDSQFVSESFNNFLWVAFTRTNPATDIFGINPSVILKHWGCRGALVLDARLKTHHAPPLLEDPKISARVDALAAKGGPLYNII